jgi:drug/metabolite transporter (DMT)-like permease
VALRSMCLVVASLFLGLALHRMPVAETTAIMFLGPLLVVAVAGPLLGEKAGLWGVAAALGGFAGVLLIVRPGSGLDGLGVVFLAINVVANVAYAILSRLLAPTESAITLLFYTALAGTIAFGATLPWTLGTVIPSLLQGALLVGLGVAGGLGHFAYTAAFRHAPASFLAPVNYLQLVWAGLLGWLVFDHVPDLVTIAGMAIVTASGVSVALRATRKTVAPAEAIGEV